MKHFKALTLAIFCILFAPVTQAEIYLVAHPDLELGTISDTQLKKLYLGKIRSIDGKTKIRILEPNDPAVQARFYKLVVKKSPTQWSAYWSRILFTGKGTPPLVVKSYEVPIRIRKHAEYIGYLEADKPPEGLQIILVL